MESFGIYGFPESHATSFAPVAYASAWLKCWHPDVFCAALLSAQPISFYAPAQVVRDAQAHGVEVRPVCVAASRRDCTLEPRGGDGRHGDQGDDDGRLTVRLGLRMVAGLRETDALLLLAYRGERPFASVEDLGRHAGVPVAALVRLAEADAFSPALRLDRRAALWAIKGLGDAPLPVFAAAAVREGVHAPEAVELTVALRPMPAGREVVEDYGHVGLTLRGHLYHSCAPTCAGAASQPAATWPRRATGAGWR